MLNDETSFDILWDRHRSEIDLEGIHRAQRLAAYYKADEHITTAINALSL